MGQICTNMASEAGKGNQPSLEQFQAYRLVSLVSKPKLPGIYFQRRKVTKFHVLGLVMIVKGEYCSQKSIENI